MERLIKHLRYSLILTGLLFSIVAKADVWDSPRVKTYYSDNKEFKVVVDRIEEVSKNQQAAMDSNSNYDKSLAEKLGGDDYEIFTWYGSAALPEYLPAADKIWKLKP